MHCTILRLIKMFLVLASPLQRLLAGSSGITHIFCARQALEILSGDGKMEDVNILKIFWEDIEKGVLWADKFWKNFFHYYDPVKKRGIGILPDARSECVHYLDKAYRNFKIGRINKAFFYLGACAHLVQDACVPHHAKGIVFSRHALFEKWVESNYYLFKADKGGIYLEANDPAEYIDYNARISRDYLPLTVERSAMSFKSAASILLPLAQKSTAGFFSDFLRTAALQDAGQINCRQFKSS